MSSGAIEDVRPRAGYVYFARSGDEVKIGFTRNPSDRIRALKTARPDVQLVCTVEGPPSLEFSLHQHFKSDRISNKGAGREWFRWTPAIASYVEDPHKKENEVKTAQKFAEWIRKYGEETLATDLGVSYWTVLKWRQAAEGQPNGSTPRPKHLTKLLELGKGKLKPADIYPAEG